MNDDALERVAEAAHLAQGVLLAHMIEKWYAVHDDDGETFRARWMRQAATPYAELSEAEKEADRIEARRYIAAYRGLEELR